MTETSSPVVRMRVLHGAARTLERLVLVGLSVSGAVWALDVPTYLGFALFREQFLGLYWALALGAVFLCVPGKPGAPRERVPWYDWIGFALSLVVGAYVMLEYPRLLFESALATPDKYLLGAASLGLLIEATRRLLGRFLLALLLLFLAYGATAEFMPGLLNGNGVTLQRLSIYLYLDTNSLFGLPLVVASTIVLAYILLGQALFASGGGAFFTDLAMSAMGRFRGGPAKIAVAANSLFGTISGTAVSNVVSTGIITIPLMKRSGYRAEVAGAVEAVASTGGQIMPPVMGAAAFLIAEFLEISYGQVVLAALVPALLYYFLLFIQVDLEAAKHGIAGLPRSELPRLGQVLAKGWPFVVPLVVLIVTLFWLNFPAGKAGMAAIGAVVAVTILRGAWRPNVRTVVSVLEDTGRSLLEISVITGIAGIVIGVLNLSGLGFSISLALVKLGGGSLLGLLVLAAVMSIILGMGMPTASVYILLAVLIAPALEKLGLAPISAHLFILYFGLMSMITPPVAIASYAAAAIAGSNPVRTGWESVRLGAMAYVVPFVFVYSPELLLLEGTVFDIYWSVASTALGAFCLGVGLTGYLFRPLTLPARAAFLLSAFVLFFDHRYLDGIGHLLNLGGALTGVALYALEALRTGRFRKAAAGSATDSDPAR